MIFVRRSIALQVSRLCPRYATAAQQHCRPNPRRDQHRHRQQQSPVFTSSPSSPVAQVLVAPAVGVPVPGQVAPVGRNLKGEAAAQDHRVVPQARRQLRQAADLAAAAAHAAAAAAPARGGTPSPSNAGVVVPCLVVHPHEVLLRVYVDLDAPCAMSALGAVGLGGRDVSVAPGGAGHSHKEEEEERK